MDETARFEENIKSTWNHEVTHTITDSIVDQGRNDPLLDKLVNDVYVPIAGRERDGRLTMGSAKKETLAHLGEMANSGMARYVFWSMHKFAAFQVNYDQIGFTADRYVGQIVIGLASQNLAFHIPQGRQLTREEWEGIVGKIDEKDVKQWAKEKFEKLSGVSLPQLNLEVPQKEKDWFKETQAHDPNTKFVPTQPKSTNFWKNPWIVGGVLVFVGGVIFVFTRKAKGQVPRSNTVPPVTPKPASTSQKLSSNKARGKNNRGNRNRQGSTNTSVLVSTSLLSLAPLTITFPGFFKTILLGNIFDHHMVWGYIGLCGWYPAVTLLLLFLRDSPDSTSFRKAQTAYYYILIFNLAIEVAAIYANYFSIDHTLYISSCVAHNGLTLGITACFYSFFVHKQWEAGNDKKFKTGMTNTPSISSSEYRVVTKGTTLEPGDQLIVDLLSPGRVHRVIEATYEEVDPVMFEASGGTVSMKRIVSVEVVEVNSQTAKRQILSRAQILGLQYIK